MSTSAGDQLTLDRARELRSVMHRRCDDRIFSHLTLCGVRAADVPSCNGSSFLRITCEVCRDIDFDGGEGW